MSTRRTFLRGMAAIPFAASTSAAPKAASVRGYGDAMPDMLLSYLQNKTNALAVEWERKRAQIRTPAALEERNRFVRARCREMIHGLPERTPLNPVTVRVLQRDGYRIECVMFESRPNFWVTASLYVPAGQGPFPGIISPCGHYPTARLYPAYQYMYLGLVHAGFMVLAYDPIGQGERRYYWNPATNQNEIGGPVTWEHSLPGQLLLLIGQDLTHYRIWDGMRAIDYLLTRPEVDPQRIGCCGQSGGGTLTTFISALDERVKCVAAHEGGMHRRWPVHIRPETPMGTGDTEQHFFPAAIHGIDGMDLSTAIAPRPLLSTIEHFSNSYNAVTAEVRARYELLGVPEKFHTVESNDPHDMTMRLRLANTDWFCRWFQNRPGPEAESDFRLETAADVNCLPDGSIRYSGRGDTIYSILRREVRSLALQQSMAAADLRERIRSLLRLHPVKQPLGVRLLTQTPRRHYHIEKLEFLSEPGIYIPAWVFVPERRGSDHAAILYVSEQGKEADGLEFGVLEDLTLRGNLVISVDVRGIGETRPRHAESGQGPYRHVGDAEATMQYMAWEINESLTGMRVHDVMRSVDYAMSRTDVDTGGVRTIGKGMGALWVLFAAALDNRLSRLVCDSGLLSYAALASSDRYLHGASVMIPDVLKHFDLPQVAGTIGGARLALFDPVDAMKVRVDLETAGKAYGPSVRMAARNQETSLAEQYLKLLG